MSTFVRSSFKGSSAGALAARGSEKVAGMLPVIYEVNHKTKMDLGLRNDRLKQIKKFETRRKL